MFCFIIQFRILIEFRIIIYFINNIMTNSEIYYQKILSNFNYYFLVLTLDINYLLSYLNFGNFDYYLLLFISICLQFQLPYL